MPATLPSLTRTMDNAFMETWQEIRADAIDNVTLATVVTAKLREKGCFVSQRGGDIISRSIEYAIPTDQVQAFSKGDTLGMGESETHTQARWTWRNKAIHVQRSLKDDQQNSGKFKIASYIQRRLDAARKALRANLETDLERAVDTTETAHKFPQSLNDMIPPYASATSGTYGGIARPATYAAEAGTGVLKPATGNTWWGPLYKTWTLPIEVNMISDMKTLWNSTGANVSYPDFLLTTQTLFETYEEFALDMSQIVKSTGSAIADLGFSVLKFKGADLTWSPNAPAGTMRMINTENMELVYDPQYWMQMTEWKAIPIQLERLAHIVEIYNLIHTELRRCGMIYTA